MREMRRHIEKPMLDHGIMNYNSFLIIRSVLLLMHVILDISVCMNHCKCLN
jgi:hypothetical protein